MGFVSSGRRTEASGEIEILRGPDSLKLWSEITVAVFNGAGDPVTTATGIITGQVLKVGQGQRQNLTNTLNLATDHWSYRAELSAVQRFFFTISGLNAGYTYSITVASPEGR